jgi:hypothetical protein
VPTLAMTSAWDITAAVAPPRSAFLHYPLGHQTGKPGDLRGQIAIVRAALEAAWTIEGPGEIVRLPFHWDVAGDEGWEARAYAPGYTPAGPDGKPLRNPPA